VGVRAKNILFDILALVVFAVLAVVVGFVVYNNGTYPGGIDTLCHIYKGDVLYQNIQQGNLWPFYDPLWYNGVEMMRYWAPLPVYAFAGCEALAGGNPLTGFVVFCALVFFVGAASWFYVGCKIQRRWLGLFIGILWFFEPNNLIALFYEGNLPRCIVLAVIPVLIYWVWSYLRTADYHLIPCVAVLFALIALCHSGYAGMLAIAMLIYFVCWGIAKRSWRRSGVMLVTMLVGYLIIGLWLVPSLLGGITSTDSRQIMAGFFQSFWKSINPLQRFESGNVDFYFGLAAFILCVFGLICSKRDSVPGFAAALVILVCTSTAMYPVLSVLPGGQYLWMLRFVSIALAFSLFSLLIWKTLRKGLLVLCCVLLVLDALPSVSLVYGNMDGSQPEQRLAADQKYTLVQEAQHITKQRLAFVDGSALDSESAYLVTGMGNRIAMSEGAAWQSATTADNFKQVDRAAQDSDFLYLFDRSLELGDDTVLVRTAFVKNYSFASQQAMDQAAKTLGYRLAMSNGDYRLYRLKNVPDSWGTVTKYPAIGIGTGTPALSLSYPSIEETTDTNLNHYTYDDLKDYQAIYLDGFTYDDQQAAEGLVTRLSEHGVRIVISGDGIPVNKNSHDRIFLGVRCNDISFSNGYPELGTVVGALNCDLFPQGYENWHTVYLDGLDRSLGGFTINSGENQDTHRLDFAGTVKNDNIIVVGLNFGYYYSLTADPGAGKFLDKVLDLKQDALPKRTIVPTQVSYAPDRITVSTEADNVNTALAYHDEFASNPAVSTRNHLTFVNAGTTDLPFFYPYFWQGLAVTVLGVVLLVALTLIARRRQRGPKQTDTGSAAAAQMDAPVALLVPAYNPDDKLIDLLEEMRRDWNGPMVVVNDGSDAACQPVFDQVEAMPGVTLLAHETNRGKGAGLKTGMTWVRDEHPECLGVVTADADGQHRPDDIRAVADALRRNPDTFVLGCRDFTKPEVPRRSSMGNQLARTALKLTSGVSVSDTQTGLRAVPLSQVQVILNIKANGYELETDALMEAHRRGIGFTEVPIATVYLDDNRSSHYHPVRDSLRIAVTFVKYATSSMASSVVDLVLFTVLNVVLGMTLPVQVAVPVSTYGARVVSAGVNFWINRHMVFKQKGSLLRYAVLSLFSVTASALLVTGITMLTGFNSTIIKVCVDVSLFFMNYVIQRLWVFASKR
jgi:uncharacterized membrane protein/putative flippase GtrA